MRKFFISAIATCAIAAMLMAGGAVYASLAIADAFGEVLGGLVSSAKAEEMIPTPREAGDMDVSGEWCYELANVPEGLVVYVDEEHNLWCVREAMDPEVLPEPAFRYANVLPALAEVGTGLITIVSMSQIDEVVERIEIAFAAGESTADLNLERLLQKKAAEYRREHGLEFEQAALQ